MAATAVPYSDSESASDAPCVAPQPEQSLRQRRVVTGVVAAAALMATGAAVTVTKQASSASSSTQVNSALSEATVLQFEISDMGCSDWEAQKISLTTESGAAACVAKCNLDSTCMFANYQDMNCPGNGEECAGTGSGSCYLFKGCTYETNKYWNLYPSDNNPTSACTMSTETEDTGCSNWATLQLKPSPPPFMTATEEDCFNACAADSTCKFGNWQKLENDKCPDNDPLGFPYASQQGKGACYMFKGDKCEGNPSDTTKVIGEKNICWNLCTKGTTTTTTTL